MYKYIMFMHSYIRKQYLTYNLMDVSRDLYVILIFLICVDENTNEYKRERKRWRLGMARPCIDQNGKTKGQ